MIAIDDECEKGDDAGRRDMVVNGDQSEKGIGVS